MSRFLQPFELADTGNSKQDLRDYVENLKPTSTLVDEATMLVANNKIGVGLNIARWKPFTYTFADFAKNATSSDDITILSLGPGGFIEEVRVVVTEIWEKAGGTPIASANLVVGLTAGNPNEFITAADLKTLSTTDAAEHYITDKTDRMLNENAATELLCKLTTAGDLTQDAVQGSVDILVKYGISPSNLA